MSFTEKRLCNPTQLTTSGQTLYTVPAGKTAIIKQLVVTNVTGSAATFSLYIGSATAANALFSATSVAANDAIVINLSQVLNSTEILTALASANSTLNITISGVENDGPLNPLSTYIADGAITSAKIADGTIVNADINASAAIDKTKISGTAITAADTGTVTSTMILDGTIATADIANNAITQAKLSTDVPLSGMRNVLINGGMDVWQRGTAVKYNAGQGAYGPDRWCGAHQYQNSRTQQVSVTSPASGMFCPYACRVSNPSTAEDGGGGSRMRLVQKVESVNSLFLRNKTVTLSFWIRFSASNFTTTSGSYGDFGYGIYAYTSTTDSATNTTAGDVASTAAITAGSFPTSWTKYTLTYTVPSNTNNIEAQFGMASLGLNTTGSVNWYEITQVQLEVGSQPTQFEQRSYGAELALCQRYYVRWQMITSGGYNRLPSLINTYSATAAQGMIWHPVPMRNLNGPTSIEYYGVGITDNATFDSGFGTVTINTSNSSAYTSLINIASIAGTVTQGTGRNLELSNASSYLGLNAEL